MKVNQIIAALTLIGFISSGIYFLESRYAKASEQEKLEKRLDLKDLQDLKRSILNNKYFLKDQLIKHPNDAEIKKQLDEVIEELKDVNIKIVGLTKDKK